MQSSELSVQGQSLQTLYNLYFNKRLVVNRRYQRKLVWSVEEKVKLVDSVVHELPIPLILLAQRKKAGVETYEIIDGLQRLDTFFSFMENKFAYEGKYFDLDTIGDTKARLDAGDIEQGEEKLSRSESLAIANYQIPVSIYRDASTSAIDEVFRRINSGGRRLSLQEIRQAGVLGSLADVVRRSSASIRGDGTFSENVALNDMDELSISRRGLDYGLAMENMFWVRHDIVAQDDIRSSGDEEMVLDLVLDAVIRPWPTSGWQNRDVAYGVPRKIRTASSDEVNAAVDAVGVEELHQRILSVVGLVDDVMAGHGSLGRHMVKLETYEKGTQRQFQAVFAALYSLTFEDGMVPKSHDAVRAVLDNFWGRKLSIPTGGSAWGKDKKKDLYPNVKRNLRKAFYKPEPKRVTVQLNSRMYIDSLLQGPIAEEPLIELKQGFCTLSDPPVEDPDLFEQIMQTAVGMANQGKSAEGLILIGVADKPSAADRLEQIFGVKAITLQNQLVVGTAEQIAHLGYDVDKWWRKWQAKIQSSKLSSEFANSLAHTFKPVFCDGLLLWEMRPKSIGKPITYDGRFFVRIGSSTQEMAADDFLSHMTMHFS
ncbi:GmrSD restriction endonuclease domain-containing protein [Streptomyces misionensis]|uniref:GmrSD restriction endonuclease domain-containing protein n=1 Tax=Streptomyces misionensis TaxID=67331 RepID=UPI0036BE1F6E